MWWFDDWLCGHIARHATLGLPSRSDDPARYSEWLANFAQYKTTQEEAEAASIKMLGVKSSRANHFSALCGLIAKARAARRAVAGDGFPAVDCEVCGGSGSVSVVEAEEEPYDRTRKPTFHACCVCETGARRRNTLAASFNDGRYIPMLRDVRADKCFPVKRADGTVAKVWYDEIHEIDAECTTRLPADFRAVLDKRHDEALRKSPF